MNKFYAENYTKHHIDDNESGISTINFFLDCLLLLMGRFTSKQFDTAMMEHIPHITRVVASQLCSADDDVINGAVSILKATIFGTNHLASGCNLTDNKQMKSVLPLLLNLLDERDGTARAVVTLVAEYCSMQDIANHLLDCLKDEEDIIRAHANKLLTLVDASLVLPALVYLIYSPDFKISLMAPFLVDPSLVLPALVLLISSPDATLYSSATTTLLGVLTYHNQKPEIISMLLDCLCSLDATLDHQKTAENYRLEGLKGDVDKVLKLIPEWSRSFNNFFLYANHSVIVYLKSSKLLFSMLVTYNRNPGCNRNKLAFEVHLRLTNNNRKYTYDSHKANKQEVTFGKKLIKSLDPTLHFLTTRMSLEEILVKNWKLLVGPLVDKMFAESSNPIMVKFLSYISDYLGAEADIVFQQILLHTELQTEYVAYLNIHVCSS
ncbi:hypothetical protein L1987_30231 [Smallanthus sonchifolius]|uniref:Uncharacterized protein n=1 Tax=Smallanthus sonchifolius TaxID=185202 RepID=A0ACB9I3R5_9ASTR|nr:hypothetical protein L1987_30231 [Smallanthus sonchifolius]